ncbi:MAG: NAD(P)/FAD-dependent oxidoreductase [Lachnospiraceae bacterium]|nr:NAD(P)/FAD-dependent oxidoreductase [Lachnospiraceae bacterium]
MKVIVVGGGAAGMMAAYAAASYGCDVTLLEKNEKLGKKIYITGKGRCNFTNACDVEDLFQNVVSNPKFMYSAFYSFTNQQVMDFVADHGTPYKVERGERVFPVSDHASDVTGAFQRALKSAGVKIMLNTEVKGLRVQDGVICGVDTVDGPMEAERVIVCTGGLSYPTTGSTGDGVRFAEKLGHSIATLRPALVPMNTKEDYIPAMQGLSLKNVELTIYHGKKKLYDEFGEMLFTHFGVSGPLCLSASSRVGKYLDDASLQAEIDLKPKLDKDILDQRLLREFKGNENKNISNVLGSLLPKKMIPVFMEILEFAEDKKINSVTVEERNEIIHLLKHFSFTIVSLRSFKEAIVTQGGVSVKEINPSTMESKLVEGLYFAGEVLDIDCYTGGFNLQVAWSTGYLAGMCAAS